LFPVPSQNRCCPTADGSPWGQAADRPLPGDYFSFDFLVLDVLASLGVELHDQHLLGHRLLVLAGRVEVTGAGCGFQLDLLASAFGAPAMMRSFNARMDAG
jgi:hypothetical protein